MKGLAVRYLFFKRRPYISLKYLKLEFLIALIVYESYQITFPKPQFNNVPVPLRSSVWRLFSRMF
jgi:hypothetical protein